MNDDNLSKMNAERIPDVVSIGAAWFCELTLYTTVNSLLMDTSIRRTPL